MTNSAKSIVLISEDEALSNRIGAVLEQQPGYALTRCNGTLAKMNGKAWEMARDSELIIFHTMPDDGAEMEALKNLVQSGGSARLLAVSDSSVSLGTAHSLMRAGVSEVVPDTVEETELSYIVSRLAMPRRLTLSVNENREGQVIAISKARGGIGATTLAVNLADHLRGQKRRFGKSETRKVVLVDLDLQFGAVAGFLDLPPNEAFYQMARDRITPDKNFVEQSVETTPSGLDVLAAPDGFMPLTALHPDQMRALIARLRQSYDHVVIDLPQVMVDWLTPVLEAASDLILVSGTSVPFVQQTRRLIDFFKDQNPAMRIEVIVGQEKKPLMRSKRHAEAERALETQFTHWLPPDGKHAEEAMDRGKPLSQTAGGCPLNKEIGRITADVLKRAALQAVQKTNKAERRGK
ncbi:MAG: AAA family ATPase [Paracoccaceae bacterium]